MTDRDPLQHGLDALATMEAAAVTLLGVARQRGKTASSTSGRMRPSSCAPPSARTSSSTTTLLAAGGLPVADTFTIPEEMVTDRALLLVGILELKAIGIAGYMALAREWAAGEVRSRSPIRWEPSRPSTSRSPTRWSA